MKRSASTVIAAGLFAGTLGVCAAAPALHPLHRTAAHNGPRAAGMGHLKHIVIVIQENRSVDNLFNGFCLVGGPCADTMSLDPVTKQSLVPASLAAPFSPDHAHSNFVIEYDYGKMDGFSSEHIVCNGNKKPCPYSAFSYVPSWETVPYRVMATVNGELSDETFQPNSGPSLPAHLYSIAGQSGGDDSDRWAIAGGAGNCGTTQAVAPQILMTTAFPGTVGNAVPPCKDFMTIFDVLTSFRHTWRYYTSSNTGWWAGPENIQHLYGSANAVLSSKQFLSDVAAGNLADVTFVTPPANASDHPGFASKPYYGPNWVASVVNAVGMSPFWSSSAIVIYWDDWGGWFDHVVPQPSPIDPDPFEYGFRVPLIVVSPFAKIGTIDHTPRSYVSSLRMVEEAFSLPSLHTLDQYEPDGLDSMLDFGRPPRPFTPIRMVCPPTGTSSCGQ